MQKQKDYFNLSWLQVQYQIMCIQADKLHCLIIICPPIFPNHLIDVNPFPDVASYNIWQENFIL